MILKNFKQAIWQLIPKKGLKGRFVAEGDGGGGLARASWPSFKYCKVDKALASTLLPNLFL